MLKEYWVVTLFKLILTGTMCIGLAHAKFMLEPYAESVNGTIRSISNEKINFSGPNFGINIGYIGTNILVGMVTTLGEMSFASDPTGDGQKRFKSGGIGTYLGFHFKGTYKLWTEYQNTNIEPIGAESRRYFGQQVSFGLGYRIYKALLINYKYFNNFLTQVEDDSTGKTSSLNSNLRSSGHMIGLSLILVW